MSISREDLDRIAELARLEIPPERAEALRLELSAVLTFAEALRKLDLAGLEPSTFAPAGAVMRDDAPEDRCLDPEIATSQAPEHEDGFFIVPPIVDHVEP